MRGPHVRFCERHGGAILRAYSTEAECSKREPRLAIAVGSGAEPAAGSNRLPPVLRTPGGDLCPGGRLR